MQRVPTISKDNKPLMPTKASRARRFIKQGKATGHFNDLGIFYIKLTFETQTNTQDCAVGVDPGKLFSGVAVQSKDQTLWKGHLELPFETVTKRMEQRKIRRRTRRGRRINRKVEFALRSHRQKRYSNRKKEKLPPSIKANHDLELRVVSELSKIYPITVIVYEYVKARGDKGFSPVMVGQKWMLKQLEKFAEVETRYGYETARLRNLLGIEKSKDKSLQTPESHANDAIALACYVFTDYLPFHTAKEHGYEWVGDVQITNAPFSVIKRPPFSRRQLHLTVPAKGGARRKYGGSITSHGYRKGDLVLTPKGIGYVSGESKNLLSVSDSNWKRIGQITVSKIKLIRRSCGLLVSC